MKSAGRRDGGTAGSGPGPDLVAAISPGPTAEEAEAVAAVLAVLRLPMVHEVEGTDTVPSSRWAEAGRRAARRGIDGASGWRRPVVTWALGSERTTGGWRR